MSKQAQYEAMDAETVADLLGVSTRQLNNYIKLKDLPCNGERTHKTFKWSEVREWYVAYRVSIDRSLGNDDLESEMDDDETSEVAATGRPKDQRAANLRKTQAEVALKELSLARESGKVIVIADAKLRLERMLLNLRTRLLGVAPKLAMRLEGVRDRTERETVVADEMETLCRELATGSILETKQAPEPTDDPVD